MQLLRQAHGLAAVRGIAYHLEIGLRLQQNAQTVTHDSVVVREDYPDHARDSSTLR